MPKTMFAVGGRTRGGRLFVLHAANEVEVYAGLERKCQAHATFYAGFADPTKELPNGATYDARALYASYQAGELQADGLEAKARILAGWDHAYDALPEKCERCGRGEGMTLEPERGICLCCGLVYPLRRPLTAQERRFMVEDAYQCSPAFPPDEAPADDAGIARWWLGAMKDYVDDLFG